LCREGKERNGELVVFREEEEKDFEGLRFGMSRLRLEAREMKTMARITIG